MTSGKNAGPCVSKSRRKYEFSSREAAEAAVRESRQYSIHLYRGMLALFTKSVEWLGRRGEYRVGVFDLDSPSGPRVMYVFQPKGTTQSPSLTVTDAHQWAADAIRQYQQYGCTNDEVRGIVELAELVQQRIKGK